MSNPQILPEEWIADSLENFLSHHHSKTNIIYIAVVITLIIFLLSLPFLYVDISVEGVGNIRPIKERSTLVSPVTEIVDHVYVREGDFIRKGDPLIKFRTKAADTKIEHQKSIQEDYRHQCHDLAFLVKGARPVSFEAPNREQEYLSYIAQTSRIEADLRHFKTEWLRNKALFDEKLISEEEYSKYYYQYVDK